MSKRAAKRKRNWQFSLPLLREHRDRLQTFELDLRHRPAYTAQLLDWALREIERLQKQVAELTHKLDVCEWPVIYQTDDFDIRSPNPHTHHTGVFGTILPHVDQFGYVIDGAPAPEPSPFVNLDPVDPHTGVGGERVVMKEWAAQVSRSKL